MMKREDPDPLVFLSLCPFHCGSVLLLACRLNFLCYKAVLMKWINTTCKNKLFFMLRFCTAPFSDLHGYGRGRVLRLHLGVRRVEGSLVHELVVKLQRFQDFDVQL